MEDLGKSSQFVAFGEFELDLRTRELRVNGSRLDLQEQPFRVLSMLLERSGELVTREELTKRLWPEDTFVDFENSLNRVIKRLREALGDSAEEPRFIETLPRRGYRFIGSVRPISRRVDDLHEAPEQTANTPEVTPILPRAAKVVRLWRQRTAFAIFVLALGCVAGLLTYWWMSPAPTLRVVATRQLDTLDGVDPFGGIVSDGSRFYFLRREGDHWDLSQTSLSGGQAVVPAPFGNTVVLAVSPDHANFLIASFVHRDDAMPLWIWPAHGGAATRIGEVIAFDGAWHADGRSILYSEDDGIYQVNLDGTNAHKFAATEGGHARFFAWSPDGRILRFSMSSQEHGSSIWQVNSDGTDLHRFKPGSTELPNMFGGSWSPDGKYYFFTSSPSPTENDIWVIRENPALLSNRREPVKLTSGPIAYGSPVPSPDGRKLVALGVGGSSELERYDVQSHRFVPWLPAISAYTLALSHDGARIAYETSPDRALVRVNEDGSQPLVLSPAGLRVTAPSWSPDGKQLAFTGEKQIAVPQIYLISSDGGTPVMLFPDRRHQDDPAWSPDGKLIAFDQFEDSTDVERASIQVFEVETRRVSLLPGAVGLRSPAWSPNGRFVAAISENLQKLMVLDMQTRKWTELAKATLLTAPKWSNDGRDLYYQDLLARNQPIYRIHLSDHKQELVTTFENALRGIHRASLEGIAADGSLIVRLNRGGAYIYALDLEIH